MNPNILYIHSHDTGRYIQPYGYYVETPNLMKLAEDGVLFRKAFSAAPTCSPSRASLLTGQYPHNSGQYGLVNRGFELPDTDKHIVNYLKRYNYNSTLIGMQHIRKDPNSIGYDQVIDLEDNYSQNVTPKTVNYIKEIDLEQPFFLSVGYEETHRPFHEIKNKDEIKYTLPPAPLPDTDKIREDMTQFKESARVLDKGIGKVINALKEKDLYKNTIIIFTTDHGLAFPKMKCTLSDHGIGVSLIIKGVNYFPKGTVIDSLVTHLDIFPTLCELIDIEIPKWVQGNSLLPIIKNEKEEVNNEIYAEINYHVAYQPTRAVRTRRWKYIRRFTNRTRLFLSNIDESLSKDFLLDHDWNNITLYKEELYDLILDPNEANNLAYDSTKSDLLEEMRNKLDKWMEKTEDPLQDGKIPAPKTALVSKDDDKTAYNIWSYIDKPEGYH